MQIAEAIQGSEDIFKGLFRLPEEQDTLDE